MFENMKKVVQRHPVFRLRHSTDLEDMLSVILFIAAIILASGAFITNASFGHSFALNSPNILIALMLVLGPIVFKNHLKLVSKIQLIIVGFLYMPFLYFTNNGYLGAGPVYFIMVIVYFPFYFQRKQLLIFSSLLIGFYVLLYYIGYRYPSLILEYPDKTTALIDNLVGLVSVGIIVTLVGAVSFGGYLRERNQILSLLTNLEKKNDELEKLTITDHLTNIYNRRYFMDRLDKLIEECQNPDFYVMMIDIDDFKIVNDKYGHLFGDVVLKKVANRLIESLRDYDLLARYGGEEFVAIVSKANGYEIAERMRKSVECINFRYQINLTISIGVSKYNKEQSGLELLNKADSNLYKAKRDGKNKVV